MLIRSKGAQNTAELETCISIYRMLGMCYNFCSKLLGIEISKDQKFPILVILENDTKT